MPELCPASCVIALLLLHTQRRDRRLIAAAPAAGAALVCVLCAGYTAWRVLFHLVPLGRADGVFLRTVLAACSGFAMPLAVAWLRALVRQDLPRAARAVQAAGGWAGVCALLGLLSAGVYFLFGLQLGAGGLFDRIDVLFDADPLYQQALYGVGIHTHTHPLLPLIWYVTTRTLSLLTGPQWVALAANSAFGGLCVALAAVYFRAITGSAALGVLAALLLGGTAAHLVFAAMPESYIVSAATLILLQLLVVRRRSPSLRLRHLVLAAVLATGVTITNILPALVCLLCSQPARRWRAVVVRWAAYGLLVGGVLISLQSLVRPVAEPLEPSFYLHEQRFLELEIPVSRRVANLLGGVTLQNVVGWVPIHWRGPGPSGPRASMQYDGLGVATSICWAGLGLAAMLLGIRARCWRQPTFVAAALCLVAATAIHSVYGQETLFLYSCSFTFYVVALLAHGPAGARLRPVAMALGAFLVLLVVNNAHFCGRIIAMLRAL